MFLKKCLLLLLALPIASAGNVTVSGRSFVYLEVHVSTLDYDNESWIPNTTVETVLRQLSEEAQVFLTSPVSTILMPSFYLLVCLISVPINLFAIVAFSYRIRPMKPATIYMVNLACADFLFALLLPFRIFYHFNGNDWIFGSILCRVVTAAFYWNMYCSILLLSSISVDRLLAVVYPINSLSWRRPRRATMACVAMWIISLAGAVPLALSNQMVYVSGLNITTCHDVHDMDELISYYKIYFIVLVCALFFVPFLVTLVSYSRVICSLSQVPQGVPGRSRRKTRALVMALSVLVMFVLCFLPTNCLLLLHYAQFNKEIDRIQDVPDGSYAAYLIFLCLGSLNCALDPLVYYFGSSQCQRQLARIAKCVKTGSDSSSTQSSSGSQRQSRSTVKSRCSSSLNSPESKKESQQGDLYKKLIV